MIFEYFFGALGNVFSPLCLLAIAAGTTAGIIIGALPGLSATMGVALLLPITFGMDPGIGLAMLIALYCGAMYGGSITAILINTPGTAAAAATCLDGFPMAQKGMGGKAIGYSLFSSFVGGQFSTVVLLLLTPPLANISLMFGPPEYCLIGILGLTLIGTLTDGNWVKGLLSGAIGLLIATVGMEPVTGVSRFTFGELNLLSGIQIVVALIGLFSISQALILMEKKEKKIEEMYEVTGKIMPTRAELKGTWGTIWMSSILGTWVGLLPGTGGDLATWIGYNDAKRRSKHPELFGKGSPEGIMGSEAANNAVCGGAFIPLLALGIPGSSVAAVLLGGMLVHGLRPGPLFMTQYGELSFTVILSMFVANFAMLGLGYIFARLSKYITMVRNEILAPVIIALSVIGTYAINNNLFDVGLMFAFGIMGYLMNKWKMPPAPMILGIILGPMTETGLGQSLLISGGSLSIFVTRPLSLVIVLLIFLSIGSVIRKDILGRMEHKKEKLAEVKASNE